MKMNINMIALSSSFSLFAVILVLFCCQSGNAFNLSPNPYVVFREPKLSSNGMPKMRSSYFGFSLNLKQNRYFQGHFTYQI